MAGPGLSNWPGSNNVAGQAGSHRVRGRRRRVPPRSDAAVFLIDPGMLTSRYGGEPSALEIDAGRITAIYLDERELLVEAR